MISNPILMAAIIANVEKALREALAAHDAAIVLDPSKSYHFGSGPEISEVAKSIAARLPSAGALTEVRAAVQALPFVRMTGGAMNDHGLAGKLGEECDWDEYMDLIDRETVIRHLSGPRS